MNNNFLEDIYINPSLGLKSKQKLYLYVKQNYKDKNITKEEIDDFINKQKPNQIFHPTNTNKYNTIISRKLGEINADIMDMNYFKTENKGLRYILFVCDVYSRRIFMRSIKDKSAEAVLKGFETIKDEYDRIGVKINNIVCDKGLEF